MKASKYKKGAEAKRMDEMRSNILLPYMSDNRPAKKLMIIPGMVEAEITYPIYCKSVGFVINDSAKRGKIGLLDMVELKMAKNPNMLINKK